MGYVGLPLAVEFAKIRSVVGFDISERRIAELRNGHDVTRELSSEELAEGKMLSVSTKAADIADCNFYIVTVPTPVSVDKRPDLRPVLSASATIGKVLKKGDIVVYESTVYPGATEEDCVPVLEDVSGLKFNVDFFVGYSPERINPGDKDRRVATIKKITSGSTPETADLVDAVYNEIVRAGTHKAPSIKVAEAAKVIENTQRDLNIAIVNEFALIFSKLGIDTEAVLKAAGTKWNFLPFRPGLVGGHCTGVDPLVFGPQGAGGRLLSRDHSCGPPPQRFDGALCGEPDHQGDGSQAHPCRGRAVSGAGLGVQGELPRSAQHPHRRFRA